MAYDSDAGFDKMDLGMDAPAAGSEAARSSDSAASGAMATAGAAAMAAALLQDDGRTAGGWDAPPPMPGAVTGGSGWALGNDSDSDSDSDDGAADDARRTGSRRRLALSPKADTLMDAALRAYTLHPDFCHQSTAEAAAQFGHRELDGQSANEQVATMRARWREVNGAKATMLADRGVLVVAGLAGAGNAGHTAIVVPGEPGMSDQKPFPRVCGGGLPMRRSDGTRSGADVWTLKERKQVRYFTPETRSWAMRALGFLFGL